MSKKIETPPVVLIERLARLMRSAENESGLNPAQWEALRYLDRANRFSNSPGALAGYLGATKGTVSQTIIALERKGLVRKDLRPGQRRSVSLALTAKGKEQLRRDPWLKLTGAVAELGPQSTRRLNRGLTELLQTALTRGTHPTFGQCRTCRYFGRNQSAGQPGGPHRCLLLDVQLMENDSVRICVEHEPPPP
jgi:DNA-binding MarR family transcriptional regulator